MEFNHKSVLLNETVEYLHINPDGIYVDGTLGGAGHALEIAKRLSPSGRLIGIDQDEDALDAAAKRLNSYQDRVTAVHSNYCRIREVLSDLGIRGADGILLDLGVSSFQLDTPERGFTYREGDSPLDMRMDRQTKLTAADIVNRYSEAELIRVIRDYGEERFAGKIARNIVKARMKQPIRTSGELAELIRASIPAKARLTGGHPAKRTYQALRIELNRELEVLQDSLDDMIDLLCPGGRICIITFHSLEDRIVKANFRKNEHPCTCPKEFPVCICGKIPKGRCVTHKPVVPGEKELELNSRAKSAKLRVFEKSK